MSVIANVLLDWKICLVGFCLLAFTSIINAKIAILPVSCLTFITCSVFVWFVSMCLTFVGLHKLLQKNDPLEFSLRGFIAKQKQLKERRSEQKPNPDKVKRLTNDIDKYFINKWYDNISKDNDFTEESKLFLEEVINRLAEVQLSVSNKVLLHGILNIYLKHLKEFRRSLKRREKYNANIEELYRYSHVCSTSSKPKNYFIHQLTTNLLRHFINSELWNSLPCHVLVSVLAKKLVLHILNLSSDPEILNYAILSILASKNVNEKYKLAEYSRVSITQYYDVKDSVQKATEEHEEEKVVSNANVGKDENHIEGRDTVDTLKIANDIEVKGEVKPELIVIAKKDEQIQISSPKTENFLTVDNRERKRSPVKKKIDVAEEHKEKQVEEKRVVSDPVKIYESKSKYTRTWHDSKDILGISLGQDPLDALQSTTPEPGRTVGRSTFWDTVKADHGTDGSPPTAANILLNEVKHTTQTTMEGLKSSIKPISDATVNTLHNIKDLQETTVNSALNKIGDFQDEAAGMVEGILDFGRAGFRKGLRLTGLQDNIENAKATLNISSSTNKQQPKKKAAKLTRSESPDKNSEDSMESVWMNPLQVDSPSYDGQILLEKPRKTEEKVIKPKEDLQIPFISTEQPEIGINSPDPEYEDAADLATSIAKLRSLLQQRSSESSLSTPALSPMPPDEFSQRTTEMDSVSDVDDVDGVMPSFYKFCAKTATGVFDKTINTIKTALPGNIQVEQSDNAWIFLQSDQAEADILTRMKKLLTERKEYCTLDSEIDTAYEAIDSSEGFQPPGRIMFPVHLEFEDELDEFEVKLPVTKALLDIMCELLADTNSPFLQEPIVKAVLLSLGNTIEGFMISKVDETMRNFCTNLITIPNNIDMKTLTLEMDVYVEAVLSSLPDTVKLTFGKSTLSKSLTLFIASIQSQKINQDMVLQIFELIAMKLIEESTQLSPPASA